VDSDKISPFARWPWGNRRLQSI